MIFYPLQKNHVTLLGSGEKKATLMLSHGFGSDQTAWQAVAEAFEREYQVILYDHVGAGRSDLNAYSPIRYSSLDAYVEDLLDIIQALDLRNICYVGHSVGSMVGLLAGIKAPEYFSKMIFIGASPRFLNDDGYQGGFEQSDLDNLYTAMQENYYDWASGFAPLAMGNYQSPQLAEHFCNTLAAIRPDIALEVARVIFQSDNRKNLPKLTVPTLLIQTKRDAFVPREVAIYLHGHIANSQLAEIEAEGHLPHISAPAEVSKAIRAFL